ncbi:hypothetical protein HR45_11205 [Shewanella mangrovi]|uniref:Uncharacterized protein n=1 Tax=Shewanella mangrovi TaxID=1515746 RepID=A0A094JDD3_9GAMM|nr:hypothetical protein [Shewanella mangrovi]KFZ37242.1 hypothetical protein HR45_11205 [Shewanella mangrovi]
MTTLVINATDNVDVKQLHIGALWRFLLPVAVVHLVLIVFLSFQTALTVTPSFVRPQAIRSFLYQAPKHTVSKQVVRPNQMPATPQVPNSAAKKSKPNPALVGQANVAPSNNSKVNSTPLQPKDANVVHNEPQSISVSDATAHYLRQQQQAAVQSSVNYAQHQKAHKSESDMTPNLDALVLPTVPVAERNGSLDSPLDPNRIVKNGDTCYRVVKTPTQLNPYAENLGFAFKCGKTDDERLLESSLKNRINQHRN